MQINLNFLESFQNMFVGANKTTAIPIMKQRKNNGVCITRNNNSHKN